ncbi:RidA family protein [Arthrobacter cryoconiti]|uniref:RidA family protein n=1 Tax=Arthrobacter cryoconiti TaxID=748907 RepID=A0ABV8QYB6_9MICC|nr:RidA family protein [Arthrobacter cryoconiti]MCC9068275.1 RidA family protein [Arthrobacter cryoconiti]
MQTTRNSIHAAKAPAAVGPYSHAVRYGGLLFLSGQTPIDPETGEIVAGGIEAQTRQVFANLKSVLTAAESNFDAVLKVNVYLTSLDDFSAMNAIYGEVFAEPYPARTTIAAACLPLGADVEIELVARDPLG